MSHTLVITVRPSREATLAYLGEETVVGSIKEVRSWLDKNPDVDERAARGLGVVLGLLAAPGAGSGARTVSVEDVLRELDAYYFVFPDQERRRSFRLGLDTAVDFRRRDVTVDEVNQWLSG